MKGNYFLEVLGEREYKEDKKNRKVPEKGLSGKISLEKIA